MRPGIDGDWCIPHAHRVLDIIAELAREDVSDEVLRAYGRNRMRFGRDYIIPKPFDNRVLYWVAPAVARAAQTSGVARAPIDIEEYRERLLRRIIGELCA